MQIKEYQPFKRDYIRGLKTLQQNQSPNAGQRSEPIWLIVASMVGILIWLIFILFYALYWSTRFNLFQNIIVFIVSLCITGVTIGLLWIVLGPKRYRTWYSV